jgi:hypothetical protein
MNPLHDAIKEKIVNPALRDRLHTIKGVVTYYDNKMNRASVEVNNPYGIGRKTFNGVPVQLGSGGTHSAGPFVGQEVWMNFIGGNVFYPRIVSLADENYEQNTREKMRHRRKGSLVPDSLMRWS